MGDSFQYSSEPRAVASNRGGSGMFREDDKSNIMHDRRVVRGNTYAAQVITANAQEEAERVRLAEERERKKRAARQKKRDAGRKPSTPPPVPGRSHIDIQTENYLEELTDKVPEVEEETQTEAFLDRPPSPMFIPAKSGIDKETQIDQGDLFDFDLEVVPILEVLVGKTLEVSMVEVMEEEELASLRQHQEDFEQVRNAELAEVQRLEAEAKRRLTEKKRRVAEETKFKQEQSNLQEKVAARSFTQNYLADLRANVFSRLMTVGHFYDPLASEIQSTFLPWVMDQMVVNLDRVSVSQALADSLIAAALEASKTKQVEAEEARAAAIRKVEEARLKEEEAAKLAAEEAAAAEEGQI